MVIAGIPIRRVDFLPDGGAERIARQTIADFARQIGQTTVAVVVVGTVVFAIWDKLIVSPHNLPFSYGAFCRGPLDFDAHIAAAFATVHCQSLIEDVVAKFAEFGDAGNFVRRAILEAGRSVLDGFDSKRWPP